MLVSRQQCVATALGCTCFKVRNYQLRRLSSSDASSLFAKPTLGTWRQSGIKKNIDVMSTLKNNPAQIHAMAKLENEWDCKTLTKLVETYNFRNKLAKSAPGWAHRRLAWRE